MGVFSPYGFRALENQNSANTQAANVAPAMPGYTGIDKLGFSQMRTPEDQIHWLYLYATGLDLNTVNTEQAQALIDAATSTLKAYVDMQDQAISEDVAHRYNYLLRLIQQLTEFPGVVVDPTWGTTRPIKTVVERVYDFDRPFSVTCEDYDMCGFTAAGFGMFMLTARDFDICFALLTYNVYEELLRTGVIIAREQDTLLKLL